MYRLQIQIQVKHQNRKVSLGVLLKRFHGFIFTMIKRVDADFASELHQRKQRQLFSFRLDKQNILLHSPDQRLVRCLQRGLLETTAIDLKDWKAHIQEIYCVYIDEADIEAAFSDYVTMKFLTPTTFYHGKNYYPLPELYRLLTSANKAYELSTGLMVSPEKLRSYVERICIDYAEIKTKYIVVNAFRITGFTGKLRLNLRKLEGLEQKIVWKILMYGTLMGIGNKTSWGLGQVSVPTFEKYLSDGR